MARQRRSKGRTNALSISQAENGSGTPYNEKRRLAQGVW